MSLISGSFLVDGSIIIDKILIKLVDLSGMQEEVIIISEKGEDLVADENETAVDGEFV